MPALLSERCDFMNETEIRKYAKLMKELGLTGLEITEDNKVVRLERESSVPTRETVNTEKISSDEPVDYISITSPIVGVFYAAPAEDADPFVTVGGRVKKGQTLCIVEAMKLMNEITAEAEGEICAVCVTNGQVVEYGTELFRIRR